MVLCTEYFNLTTLILCGGLAALFILSGSLNSNTSFPLSLSAGLLIITRGFLIFWNIRWLWGLSDLFLITFLEVFRMLRIGSFRFWIIQFCRPGDPWKLKSNYYICYKTIEDINLYLCIQYWVRVNFYVIKIKLKWNLRVWLWTCDIWTWSERWGCRQFLNINSWCGQGRGQGCGQGRGQWGHLGPGYVVLRICKILMRWKILKLWDHWSPSMNWIWLQLLQFELLFYGEMLLD